MSAEWVVKKFGTPRGKKHRCKLPGRRARRRLGLGIGAVVQCSRCPQFHERIIVHGYEGSYEAWCRA